MKRLSLIAILFVAGCGVGPADTTARVCEGFRAHLENPDRTDRANTLDAMESLLPNAPDLQPAFTALKGADTPAEWDAAVDVFLYACG